MNCFHPQLIKNPGFNGPNLRAHALGPYIQVDCGKCVACIRKKSRSICFKLDSEKMYSDYPVLWLTLTYDDDHCPTDLSRRDIQLFMKRLRKNYENAYCRREFGFSVNTYRNRFRKDPGSLPVLPALKYWYCGEYGEDFGRPHYHLFLFHYNQSVMPLERIEEIWSNGFIGFGDADSGSTVYSTLYSFVKLCVEDYDHDVPPFCVSSSNLGIKWLEKNLNYILSHPDKPYLERNGVKYPFPGSYRAWLEKNYGFHFNLDDIPNFLVHEFQLYSDIYGFSDYRSFADRYNANVSVVERREIDKLLRMKKHLNH